MNCLHDLYRGTGVTEEDLLYTLAMFVREPVRLDPAPLMLPSDLKVAGEVD